MTTEKRFWQILSILVIIMTAAIPTYVTYHLYSKGPTPIKIIDLTRIAVIDPMNALAELGNEVTLSLKIKNQSTDNFVILKEWIRNAGDAPILPTDYHEKISINVRSPWKILAVESTKDSPRSISFKWKKINDTRFEAEPALFNPNDIVSTNIYVTYTETHKFNKIVIPYSAITEWNTRIVNMVKITDKPFYMVGMNLPGTEFQIKDIGIYLYGWRLLFVVIVALVFFTLYIHLLNVAGLLQNIQFKSIMWIVGSGYLSIAAAESASSYIIPEVVEKLDGVYHIANAPWIILHALFLFYLYRKANSRTY